MKKKNCSYLLRVILSETMALHSCTVTAKTRFSSDTAHINYVL